MKPSLNYLTKIKASFSLSFNYSIIRIKQFGIMIILNNIGPIVGANADKMTFYYEQKRKII